MKILQKKYQMPWEPQKRDSWKREESWRGNINIWFQVINNRTNTFCYQQNQQELNACHHTCNLTAYWGPQFSKQPIHGSFFLYNDECTIADIEVWKTQMLNLQTTWNFIHVAVDLENCVDSNSNHVVYWKSFLRSNERDTGNLI